MRFVFLSRLLSSICFLFLVLTPTHASVTNEVAARLLPDKIGELRATRKINIESQDRSSEDLFESEFVISRAYRSPSGDSFSVTIVKTHSDRGAYALFSTELQKLSAEAQKVDSTGTLAFLDSSGRLIIFKGPTFVTIADESRTKNSDRLVAFARLVAEPLDKGENEVPVLVKHLPEWETAQRRAVYALNSSALQEAAGQRPVLEAVSFSAGTDAVTASYGNSRLVIVEHTTPQLATDSDARINARINELKSSGQGLPSMYRRVGNYSVFVFDASDEATATQLIDKIAYEQVVQWLGNNPRWFERMEREYRRTTSGVLLAVIKGSGLSLLICLAIGGIFGTIVFRRRRAQQAAGQTYTDAGGMMRLNLDDLTPEVDTARLLGKGDR